MAMKKMIMAACCWCFGSVVNAQELFAFTEPASNMAKGNIGLRMNNYIMKEKQAKGYNYHLIPEVMIGVSKKWMVHLDAFLSNRNQKSLETEGGSIYTKYRFFSKDGIQKHFRIAAYGRYSFNNSDIHQQEIETALLEVFQSGSYLLGERVKNFEKNLSSYIGSHYGAE